MKGPDMKDCEGQLLGRVRKGLASDQERTAFEAHLDTCESCQMTLAIMSDFDAIGQPEPGDFERVMKMADVAVAAHEKRPSVAPVRKRRTVQLALAALAITGAAAAGVAIKIAQEAPSSNTPSETKDDEQKLIGSRQPVSIPPTERDEPEEKPARTEAAPKVETPVVEAPTKAPSTSSARETYLAANEARRAGRTQQAIRAYETLQRRFPSAPESHASRVSLGGLLLKSGSAGAALAQFDAYLGSGGQLAAEALFGRAQSLRALGRSAEEAQNLNRLVKNYPKSAYATHAERRLRELR